MSSPQTGSRSESPTASFPAGKSPNLAPAGVALPLPTTQEILTAIPANGISVIDLCKRFEAQINGRCDEFYQTLKTVARVNRAACMAFLRSRRQSLDI
jgi:hypothetical protein